MTVTSRPTTTEPNSAGRALRPAVLSAWPQGWAGLDEDRFPLITALTEKPRLFVMITSYPENIRTLPTVGATALHLSQRGEPWELIVADDGSADGTVALLDKLDLANLRVLVAKRNGGPCSAVRRGMLAARGDYIGFADTAQSTPIEQFDTLLSRVVLNGYAVATGSRAAVGAVVTNNRARRLRLAATSTMNADPKGAR